MLSRQKRQFSKVFYKRCKQHFIRVFSKLFIYLGVSGGIAIGALISILHGQGDQNDLVVTSIALAIFLFLLWTASGSVPEFFRVRVLPYFERRLGNADGWLAGKSLLLHSRQLDEIARRLGIRPLSDFASGDDMVLFEKLRWFPAKEALNTTERLLQADVCNEFSPELVSDLRCLKSALSSADSNGIKFCLLLREGSSTSGLEMDRRKGSFF
jgi:hypothetical protein